MQFISFFIILFCFELKFVALGGEVIVSNVLCCAVWGVRVDVYCCSIYLTLPTLSTSPMNVIDNITSPTSRNGCCNAMNRLTKGRVPDLDDLLRQIELDELAETAHQEEGEQRTDFSAEGGGSDELEEEEGKKEEEEALEDSILDELLNEDDDGHEDDDE
jgi:hypothetical protein